MTGERVTLDEIERAAVRGWPALATRNIDGWLARSSSRGSVRANSVSALAYTGSHLDRALAEVVAFYRAENAAPRFTITDVSAPAGLDAELAGRGWQRHTSHLTMRRDVGPIAAPASAVTVVTHSAPTPDWYRIYLDGLSEDRRRVAPQLVERVPAPCMFFSGVRDGEVIACGLSVLDARVASIQCMATLASARRTGAAKTVLAAIEAFARNGGAQCLYLQADGSNAAAIGLYQSIGFTIAGRYHTRELLPSPSSHA